MNKQRQETDEILNELTSIEFDDDDALTLLDDEEMTPVSRETIEDDDIASFYLDTNEEEPVKEKVDFYSEQVVSEPIVVREETKVEEKEEEKVEPVKVEEEKTQPNQYYKNGNNVDAYLNGTYENRKEEVKVEKVTPNVVLEKEVEQPKKAPVETESPKAEPFDMDNLNQLFAKVSNNVRGASDIVNKNAEIKRKIDERFNELKKLQEEHERNKQNDYAEINAYKDEVYNKLKEKKKEVEQQMTLLKQAQDDFAKAATAFEKEKATKTAEWAAKEEEMNRTIEDKMKSIEQIEQGLVKRKEQLDVEKVTVQHEREQCEKEKKELAENLVKFNQLVDDFTKGVDRFNETN